MGKGVGTDKGAIVTGALCRALGSCLISRALGIAYAWRMRLAKELRLTGHTASAWTARGVTCCAALLALAMFMP